MNERIRELYLKSLSDNQEFCYQKFAELIVRECCNQIYDRGEHSDGYVTKYKIRRHFGIEE